MYRIKPFERILNLQANVLPRDFRLNPLALLLLGLFAAGGIAWQLASGSFLGTLELMILAAAVLGYALVAVAFPSWAVALLFAAGLWIKLAALSQWHLWPLQTLTTLGFVLAPALQIAHHWEKAVILRLGRFHRLRGPGVFLLAPFTERVTRFIDTRIRATDFSAEKTITMDTVPVHVDALAFWMIWDARKAILEVENFMEAVVLSAQTALRDSIGRHELADLLSWAVQHEEDEIRSTHTTRGLQLSAGRVATGKETIRHYALSCPGCFLDRRTVYQLADTVLGLAQVEGRCEIVLSDRGVFHLLVHEPAMGGAE